jgi:hypothetical protein
MADGVSIKTDEVDQFARKVRNDADGGLSLAARHASNLHADGITFGTRMAGHVIQDAHRKYADALEATEANLRTYVEAARVFADVAAKVAAEFGRADATAAAQHQKVEEMLKSGLNEAASILSQRKESYDYARTHVSGVRAV